jgi:hypothetical protein
VDSRHEPQRESIPPPKIKVAADDRRGRTFLLQVVRTPCEKKAVERAAERAAGLGLPAKVLSNAL